MPLGFLSLLSTIFPSYLSSTDFPHLMVLMCLRRGEGHHHLLGLVYIKLRIMNPCLRSDPITRLLPRSDQSAGKQTDVW